MDEAEPTPDPPPTQPQSEPPLPCAIALEYSDRVNFAMQQNATPLVDRITLTSAHDAPLEDLTIRLTLDNAEAQPWTCRLERLDPQSSATLTAEDFTLSVAALAQRTEAERCTLRCEVTCAQATTRETRSVDLLPFDHWPGVGHFAELTAAFVTPNHPDVATLLGRARASLGSISDSDALDGYQSKSRQRVAQLAEACFHALAAEQIGYINPPASFERTGQRVRLIDRVHREKLGTCMDLSLALMSLWEQCGLHPLLLLTQGHAMPAVWTHETHLAQTVIDEPARIRNLIELGELLPVESTHLTQAEPDFVAAVEAAKATMQSPGDTFCAIDIRASRKRGVRPLPLRTDGESGVDLEAIADPAVSSSVSIIDRVVLADRADALSAETRDGSDADAGVSARIDRWQKRLLDLSLRNRLLNFKETGRTLPLDVPDLAMLEDLLSEGDGFDVLSKIDADEAFALEELNDRRLHAQATEKETAKRLLNLYRTAKSSIEETGANILYLALGQLKWYEHDATDQPRLAPLVLLPITLHRASVGGGYRYRIELNDEPLYPNVTLLEKLRTDFGIDADTLDDLPEDEAGLDIDLIFRNFRSAIRDVPKWEVLDAASIGLFSFNKFLMWKDLREKTETLKQNRLVRHLIDLPEEDFDEEPFPDQAELDDRLQPDDLLCTRDADSSQLAAICSASQGRSFVLEGPPGTGKSQTIANIVSDALAHGRRVLFVAEKMAALSVVRRRLEQDGLGAFCLELHSAKASKKQVLAQIQESLHAPRNSEPRNWDDLCKELGATRDELNAYVRAMHHTRSTGESLYRMVGRLQHLGEGPTTAPPCDTLTEVTEKQLHDWLDAIRTLQARARPIDPHETFALRGIGTCPWSFSLPQQAESSIAAARDALEQLAVAINAVLQSLALTPTGPGPRRSTIASLTPLCELLQTSPRPHPDLLTGPHAAGMRQRIREAIELGRARDAERDRLLSRYRDEFLRIDPLVHLDAIRRHLKRGSLMRWFTARGVKKPLRPYAKDALPPLSEVVEHLERVSEVKRQTEQLQAMTDVARALGPAWQNGDADWQAIETHVHWCERFAEALTPANGDPALPDFEAKLVAAATAPPADIRDSGKPLADAWQQWTQTWQHAEHTLHTTDTQAFGEDTPGWIDTATATLTRWSEQLGELNTWCNYRPARDETIALGLLDLVEGYEAGVLPLDDLEAIFWRSFGGAWFAAVADSDDAVRRFQHDAHRATADRFRLLDKQMVELTRHVVTAKLDEDRPRPSQAASQSEMGILRREIEKKRRHLPTRRLIESIPTLLPRLKPCFLMSPLSVAQFLATELPPFDLVVFDEASQIPVWDAIGAIARGKEVIVVGDSKQLPPTTFFSTLEDEEHDALEDLAVDDMESILKECNAAGIPGMRLKWHYRSRHESLITFSNHHYYQNELHTFPSPVEATEKLGVTFRHIEDGVYDRGGSRTNQAEAEKVVEQVVSMLIDPNDADTIGIVTFSQAQQNLVEDLLDAARREHPEIEPYLSSDAEEPVFVKNLENVQGDERDAILFSIGYGPDQDGKQSMNFGPLNKEGGERRLNVAVTRARRRLIVFSSMTSDAIDLRRTRATGVRDFKTFLDFAQHGPRAIPDYEPLSDDALDFKEGFESVVREALIERGWDVDTRVGCAGYRIDLAVRHPDRPGRYLVGIECDGKSYHSAKTARDRDRIREAVLEGLGWRIERAWSTQWHVNRRGALDDLHAAIEAALDASRAESEAESADTSDNASQPTRESSSDDDASESPTDWLYADAPPAEPDAPESLPIYRPARLTKRDTAVKDLYTASADDRLAKALTKIVAQESPVTEALAMHRFAEAFGVTRATQRYRDRFEAVRDAAVRTGAIRLEGDVLWRIDHEPATFKQVRVAAADQPASERDLEDIPLIELVNACEHVLSLQFGLPHEDLIREAGKLFGIDRATARVVEVLDDAVQVLIDRGDAASNDGRITPIDSSSRARKKTREE
jgi:very-short-patch-repair endonuclease